MTTKTIRDGSSFNKHEVEEVLMEFSSFKDRVYKKFKVLANELEGKPNEHELWVNLYSISTDYADELVTKRQRQQENLQKIS
ncbi:MAG: hypothetical protein FWC60_07475 [Firmicutes bacterium]|nr:hypothetical protein [Bacillota bacterium]